MDGEDEATFELGWIEYTSRAERHKRRKLTEYSFLLNRSRSQTGLNPKVEDILWVYRHKLNSTLNSRTLITLYTLCFYSNYLLSQSKKLSFPMHHFK